MDGQTRSVAERVRRQIITDIDASVLKPGDRLGSERNLAARFNTSRSTLRQVLAVLEQTDVVHRRHGRTGGTFVGKGAINRDLSSVTPVSEYLSKQGYEGGATVIGSSISPADTTVAGKLSLSPGDLVYCLERVWMADSRPVSFETAWFSAYRFPRLLDHSLNGPMYELMADVYDATPGEAIEQIEVVLLDEYEAPLLGCDVGSPALQVIRQTVDANGVPFEYSRDLFHAGRTRITVRLPGWPDHRRVSHHEATA